MTSIEPHPQALLCFATFWSIAIVGIVMLSGLFPLATAPALRPRSVCLVLIGADLLLLLALIGASVFYGFTHLRLASFIVVLGSGLLFAPGLFNIWPDAWRDGLIGLVLVFCASAAALMLFGAVSRFAIS